MRFIVPIHYTGLAHFSVEAATSEDAKEQARIAFGEGKDEVALGSEYEEIERVGTPEGKAG
jgi:hypothetical protein